ncbi:hypothetical protein L3X38_000992 [Prunus dulcis]|uniref:Reverse transcriptase Ty1/copia-type domain-containing protein n=1 Tax=Prunus dulcis TaxID=3755 RepID=A0AAD4WR71_PRUDU|nr:hypothetical protein L3X38_000992 [Prunus dulcis]
MFFLSDVPNHVLQRENTIKEAHNWFEIEIQGKKAQIVRWNPCHLAQPSRVKQHKADGTIDRYKARLVAKRLRKALYGLKQSPRAWFRRFTKAMKKCGYHQVTGDDIVEMDKLQKCLASEFEMKDLGALKYFLGVEVTRSPTSICLSLRKFVLDMLTEIGMLGYAPAKTPILQNHYFAINPDQVPTKKERYQRLEALEGSKPLDLS